MEFIDQYGRKLNNTQIGQVLHSTILNIDQQNKELTKIAIQALGRAIPLTAENFAVDDQRAFIIEGLFKAAEMDDSEIQEIALQAISEVPFVGYQQIDQMIPNIGTLTHNLLQSTKHSATR